MNYKKIYVILTIAFLSAFTACKKEFNGYLNNPNSPSPTTADVDLYLNQVQVSFRAFWTRASDLGAQLTRQQYWVGPFYRNGYTPASFDDEWTSAYTGVIANADALIPLAQSQKKYVNQELPDLILMDMSLPEIDGLSATRRIKEIANADKIPVICVTAHGDYYNEKAIKAGCKEVVAKPVDLENLSKVIESYLKD